MIPTLLIQHDNLNPDQDQAIADTLQKIKDQVRLLLHYFLSRFFFFFRFFFLHLIFLPLFFLSLLLCFTSCLLPPFLPSFPLFIPHPLSSTSSASSASYILPLLLLLPISFLLFFLTPSRPHLSSSPFTPGTANAYTLITS